MPVAPVVSIAIVTYNATDYVRRCLESLRAHTTLPHEILVVDNASREDTRDYLRTVDFIRLQLNDENRLWCPALNQALATAHPASRYFMLLNPDVEALRDDWLERLLAALASGPRVGITGTQHNYRPLGPLFGAIDGHCFLFRRELYDDAAIGPLDEAYPWNGSPYVFTARAWAKGWRYRLVPPRPAILIHHGAKSRAEAASPVLNRKIDALGILKDAGLDPWRESRLVTPFRRALIRRGKLPAGN
ncbi:MAG: glycosyltransferase [Acidobacteria bacterium]|nr:glycosyltransferase [Acidobacteriota bacterium]